MSPALLGNRFRILAELGQGSMGTVYRVADTLDADREVALKRLRVAGQLTPELRLRFKEEFRAMTRLRHPNTIEVYAFGHLDEVSPYLTMEVVPGLELTGLARGAVRAPLTDVYDWLIQLLQALAFIHSRFYVHRDIKAQNVRIMPDGRLKLMDFGLMERTGTVVRAAALAGTPGYMPPEAITGGTITPASDLYAVGCLAYELLTGRLPFEGRVLEVVRAHVEAPPPPPSRLAPQVPADLEAIVLRLLAKDPAARYPDAASVIADLGALSGRAVAEADLAQRTSYLVASALVGRDAELAALEGDLAAARGGVGAAVFLGAPAGLGKSRLLREVLLQAQWQELLVLQGTCSEAGQEPLGPLVQALRPLLAASTPEERARHHATISRLFPEAGPPPTEMLGEADQAGWRADLATWLAEVAARVPVVLALEDLQWADAPTLEALNDLIPRLAALPVLVLATLRTDETPAGSAAWHSVNEGQARLVTLGPLAQQEVVGLVEAMLGRVAMPEAFAAALHATTGGNAYDVTEMLRYLMEERVVTLRDGGWQLPDDVARIALPATVEDTVRRRLHQLSPLARRVAATAAVLGRHPERAALQVVAEVEDETLFAALDELVERQFLAVEEQCYSFPHGRVREALYDELPDAERRRLHGRYARHLEADTPGAHALAELAWHFSRGEDLERAFHYQAQLGDQCRKEGLAAVAVPAWLAAAEHLEAIAHPDKEALLARLRLDIGVYGYNVAPREAIAALDKAFPFYEAEAARLGDAASRTALTQCLAALAAAYGHSGEPAVARAMADLLEAVGDPAPSPQRSAARAVHCPGHLAAGHFDALVSTAREASRGLVGLDLAGCPPLVHASRISALGWQNYGVYQGYRPEEALRDYALGLAQDLKAHHLAADVLHVFALWNAWTGREDAALAVIEELNQLSRRAGAPPSPYVLYLRPYILWQRGALDDALALVRQALRYPHLDQTLFGRRLIEVLHGSILHGLGDDAGAEAVLWPIEAHARQAGLDFVRILALLALAPVLLAQGDRENGVAALRLAESACAEGPARNPLHQAHALRGLAERALAEDDAATALALLTRAEAIAADPQLANALLEAHLKADLAGAHAALGQLDAARQALITAGHGYLRLGYRHLLPGLRARMEGLTGPVLP